MIHLTAERPAIPSLRSHRAVTQKQEDMKRPLAAPAGAPTTIQISRLWTASQNGDATLFDPYGDALSLGVDVFASPELLALPGPMFFIRFQILDMTTNQVLVNETYLEDFNWGGWFSFWIGNNWGPDYDTPYRWGLNWTQESVFGVRALIRAHSWQPPNGLLDVDAFDVADPVHFRVKQIFGL